MTATLAIDLNERASGGLEAVDVRLRELEQTQERLVVVEREHTTVIQEESHAWAALLPVLGKVATALGRAASEAYGQYQAHKQLVAVATELDRRLSLLESAAIRVGAKFAGYGAAVGVSIAAFKALTAALEHSGRGVDGFENNLERTKAALGDFGGDIVRPFHEAADAVVDWWQSTNILKDIWEPIDREITRFTDDSVHNIKSINSAWNEATIAVSEFINGPGDDLRKHIETTRELAQEHAKLAEAFERSAEHYERIAQINKQLDVESRLSSRLREVGKADSIDQLNAIENAARQRAGAQAQAGNFLDTEHQAEYESVLRAIVQRRITIEEQTQAKLAALREKEATDYQRLHESMAESDRINLEKRIQAEIDAANQQIRLQQQIADARREFETSIDAQLRERMALRADLNRDFESAHKLRMENIRAEMNLAVEAAETEEDKQRAAIEGLKRLRDAEHQKKMQDIQREHQAEQERIAKQVESERKAAEERKRLVEQQRAGLEQAGAFGQIAQQMSQRQIFEQIAKQRTASAKEDFGGTAAQFKQMQRSIRRQLMQDMMNGNVGQGELQQAQSTLFNDFTKQAAANGKLGQTTLDTLRAQARQLADQAQAQLELEREMAELKAASKSAAERTRAQRAGLKG